MNMRHDAVTTMMYRFAAPYGMVFQMHADLSLWLQFGHASEPVVLAWLCDMIKEGCRATKTPLKNVMPDYETILEFLPEPVPEPVKPKLEEQTSMEQSVENLKKLLAEVTIQRDTYQKRIEEMRAKENLGKHIEDTHSQQLLAMDEFLQK